MTLEPKPWAELSDLIAAGDRAAESRFADLFLPRIQSIAYQRTKNWDLAQDLGQETMMRALSALRKGRLREACSLPAFLHGILRNLMSENFRGREKENLVELPANLELAAHSEPTHEERTSHARQAIRNLDDLDQRILLMTLVDGKKPAEIARDLNLTGTTVRQRKHRAIAQVSRIVKNGVRMVASPSFILMSAPE